MDIASLHYVQFCCTLFGCCIGDCICNEQSGDKVLIIHDGVETSYPSRTGGYHIFCLSKGDGSYKPADEVLGISTYVQIGWTVLLDGVNPLTQPETVQHSRGYANISLTIPDGWEYYAEDSGDENDFCIAFWPEGQTEGKIKVWYYDSFGVCGTGLEEEKITIGEYEAYQGTYDNRKTWNFISFLGMPGSYVVLNEGTDTWWSEYGEEAMQILATVKIADGVIEEAEAIEIAKKNVTVEYDQTRAKFDAENGLWTVSFSKKNTAGGDQVITITHEGKNIDEEYGE